MGRLSHIVQLQFKSDVRPSTIQEAIDGMLSLQEQCLHPQSQKPYIVFRQGGKECSIEGLQNGITHVFVVGFASVEDRDYYTKEDPVHREYAARLGPLVANAQVVDIEDGVF